MTKLYNGKSVEELIPLEVLIVEYCKAHEDQLNRDPESSFFTPVIARILAENSGLKRVREIVAEACSPKWIPVEELPEGSEHFREDEPFAYLGWNGSRNIPLHQYSGYWPSNVTHWQHLLPRPTKEESKS